MAASAAWADAAEVMSSALELAPDWAAGWYQLGDYFESAGDAEAAASAWRKAIELEPSDPFGAGLKIDLQRAVPVAETMPAAFVETLFDQYAPRFEASLVGKLDYTGPDVIMRALTDVGLEHANSVIDLGCGTGLMGQALRDRCDWLGGYDVSQEMLKQASHKGVYDFLGKQDLCELDVSDIRYDLIVAADVFIYVGALERVIGWAANSLAPRGQLAFTVERGDAPLELRESRRFAHSEEYVLGVLRNAGFKYITLTDCVLRKDRGEDVKAFCVVAAMEPLVSRFDRDGGEVVAA